ncbi:MAG: hypothetical protein HC814_07170 [Rhodobacteraceae bacterium]|nr:hypothetical protein [Paracoccaceae bacterium]
MLDYGMPLDKALAAPRWHHQWSPNELKIEGKVGDAVLKELEARGHTLDKSTGFGACNGVTRLPDRKEFTGVSDPRVPGAAKGFDPE